MSLGFNIVTATPSSATLSGWMAMDGNIRYVAANGGTFGWGNSGTLYSTCTNGGVSATGTNGLFDCGGVGYTAGTLPAAPAPTTAAVAATGTANGDILPGSQIFVPVALGSETWACGTAALSFNSAFHNDDPLSTPHGFGATGANTKDSLSDVYAVARTNSAGELELYFGAERAASNGDSHVDFEFLQHPLTVTNTCSGNLSGQRSQGDLLVEADFTGGGSHPVVVTYEWQCPGSPAQGTLCDTTGTYNQVTTPAATGAVNTGTIPCGGWVCRSSSGVASQSIAPNDFVEGAIDLSTLNLTNGCFSTFLPHTRESQSFNANVTEFAGPLNVDTCQTPGFTTQVSSPSSASLGSGTSWGDTATVTGTASAGAPGGSVDFSLCQESSPGTPCTSGGTSVASVTITSAMQNNSTDVSTVPLPTANKQSPTAAGTYCFYAAYNAPSTGSKYESVPLETNPQDECFTVTPASTTVTTAAGSGIVVGSGGSVTDTANVFSSGGVALAAGDNVQFYLCKISSSTGQTGSCAATAGNADGSPVAVSGTPSASGTTSAVHATSPSVSPTTAGSYCFSAVFSAPTDANYTGSSENTTGSGVAAECFNVSPASTSTVTQTSGSVTLSPTGSATDTANIFSTGGQPLAAGDNVQFYLCKISS
ncbi:MAG: hypothetical protein KGJ77_08970, partial [Acidobacteriota bacterium]|nr:hypothetical protein [Acidobacteriota bacterium]